MAKTRYVDVPDPTAGDLVIAGQDGQWRILSAGEVGDHLVMHDGLPAWIPAAALGWFTTSLTWLGHWEATTPYVVDDAVRAGDGASYVCILAHDNQEPPNTTYWDVLAAGGADGVIILEP